VLDAFDIAVGDSAECHEASLSFRLVFAYGCKAKIRRMADALGKWAGGKGRAHPSHASIRYAQ
jgi:hypothetical protein